MAAWQMTRRPFLTGPRRDPAWRMRVPQITPCIVFQICSLSCMHVVRELISKCFDWFGGNLYELCCNRVSRGVALKGHIFDLSFRYQQRPAVLLFGVFVLINYGRKQLNSNKCVLDHSAIVTKVRAFLLSLHWGWNHSLVFWAAEVIFFESVLFVCCWQLLFS